MDSDRRTCTRALCRHLYIHSANVIGWPCAGCKEVNHLKLLSSHVDGPVTRMSIRCSGAFAWCDRCWRNGVPPKTIKGALRVPPVIQHTTAVTEQLQLGGRNGEQHLRDEEVEPTVKTSARGSPQDEEVEPTVETSARGSGYSIFDPQVRLCSWFDFGMSQEPCPPIPYADGTTWPECTWTKRAYLMQGGYINKDGKIVKPDWVVQHEDKDGNIWDVCTMCPKAGGKRRPHYCVYGHVVSDTHLKACKANPFLCGVPPPPSSAAPELDPQQLPISSSSFGNST